MKSPKALLLLACLSASLSAEPVQAAPNHQRPLLIALVMVPVLGIAAWRISARSRKREEAIPGYTLQEELGRGATAVVHAAVHNATGQAYAIKLLKSEPPMEPDAVARMRREIKLMRDLQHPGIVSLCDFGEHRGQHYMVLEKVSGRTLRDTLPIPTLEQGLDHVQSLLEAMTYAHSKDVIHRDLKPENLMIDPQGKMRLLDFGFSRSAQRNTFETMDNSVAGTPAYMAPERLMCHTTPASDQYSLGLIAYEMLTGRPAIPHGLDVAAVITKQMQEIPTSPKLLNEIIPESIDRFVMKLISKKPDSRTCKPPWKSSLRHGPERRR